MFTTSARDPSVAYSLAEYQLHYWRNKEKEEVDFVLTNDREPVVVFECKTSDQSPSRSLLNLSRDLGVPALQLVAVPNTDINGSGYRVIFAGDYLANLV